MTKLIQIIPSKTYATPDNAIKAVEKKFPSTTPEYSQLRYIMQTHTDGRFYPLFIGNQSIQAGVHFHFNCVN